MKQGFLNGGKSMSATDPRVCYEIDLEDGTRPIRTWGMTTEEVLEKVARTAGTAQLTLQRSRGQAAPANGNGHSAAPQTPRKPLTPDETMIATADLSNPAKASGAVVKLFEDATGLDVQKLQLEGFGKIAYDWQLAHPEFYDHPANVKLLTENAIRRARGLARVTAQHLNEAYAELNSSDVLVRNDEVSRPHNDSAPAPSSNGSSTPGDTRPGATFATSYQSSRLSAPPSTQHTPRLKYTREQVMKMPLTEQRRLIETNDAEYDRAFNYYNSHPQ